ncbi:lamin tail domain-containing protein [Dokdonella sp.]|uniref:lamin tail domain-containing protein n=1 Tax=Dokdonella sp. TaxID=2291710 RepID=UPI003526E923
MFQPRGFLLAGLLLSLANPASAQVVISQVYGGGGNSGATYTNDFVELFNRGNSAQSLANWSIQYSSATGTGNFASNLTTLSGTIPPGGYFLVGLSSGGAVGNALPTPDATGSINMSGSSGKVILANVATGIACNGGSTACSAGQLAQIVDLVGFGTANFYEGSAAAPTLNNTLAAFRAGAGCTDTNQNSADFSAATPAPRNAATTAAPCGGQGIPAISVANLSLDEGDIGLTPFVFTVQLSEAAPSGGITFDFASADDTAIAGVDYQTASGSETIVEGEESVQITVNVIANSTSEPNRAFTLALSNVNGAIPASLSATGTIQDDDIGTFAIHGIQGFTDTSPVAGQRVASNGNIVTAVAAQGFFMQSRDASADADPMTSEGIYVFTGSAPTVQVGDEVDLVGDVSEFFGTTELSNISDLVIVSTLNDLPTPIQFDASTPSPDPIALSCGSSNFECFEGMRVQIDNGIVARANPYFSSDNYAQIFVSASDTRSLRSPGLLYPLVPGVDNPDAEMFSGNPHIFELDADALGAVPPNTAITGGSRFSATGVVAYNFGDYEVWPTAFTVTEANTIPRPVRAGQLGEELRIGSFNMYRLCDTLANTTFTCGNGGEPDEAALALKVSRLSDYVGNVLELPDVLGVVEVENLAVLQMLADRIALDTGVTYAPFLEEGNDGGGIDVGYLVRNDRVGNAVVTQFDKNEMWLDPRDGLMHELHDRPALKLEATFSGQAFATIIVHPKSRSCVDAPSGANCTQADVDRNRLKRFTQASSMAARVQQEQVAQPDRPLLVIGDFNDYQFSDGFVNMTGLLQGTYDNAANVIDLAGPNIVDPPLWNAVTSLPANEQYSFLFTEQFGEIFGYTQASSFDRGRDVPIMQVLDHALLNGPARAWFAGFEYGRADLDAADQDERNSTTAIGVSDHDGFVVRLATDRIFADSFGGD